MSDPPLAIVTEHLDDEARRFLAAHARVIDARGSVRTLDDALPDASALVVRTYTRVDEALLRRAPRLRVVGRAGTGLDNVDVDACRARGVEVVYAPDANTQAVVEYVFSLMLNVLRPVVPMSEAIDDEEWKRRRAAAVAPRQLDECTLGILGLGRIGSRIARGAAGLGVRCLYTDLRTIARAKCHGAEPVPLTRLFAESDILTVHVDGRPGNRDLVGADLLCRSRDDLVILNTSRGFVVDNVALASFLIGHPKALAVLDVHQPEPFDASYPLLGLPNVRLFPHLASRTTAAQRGMSMVVNDVVAVLAGRTPDHPAPRG